MNPLDAIRRLRALAREELEKAAGQLRSARMYSGWSQSSTATHRMSINDGKRAIDSAVQAHHHAANARALAEGVRARRLRHAEEAAFNQSRSPQRSTAQVDAAWSRAWRETAGRR